MVRASDFSPPGCENALCSFHGRFFITEGGGLKPVVAFPAAHTAGPPEAADIGAMRTVSAVARQWGPGTGCREQGAGGRWQGTGCRVMKTLATDYPKDEGLSCCSSGKNITDPDGSGILDMDRFLELARNRSFSISAMAFQDVWNLDLERLRDCCIHTLPLYRR